MPSVIELMAATVVLVLGAALQTAVGFGIGLFAIPLLVWIDFSLPNAIAMLLGAAAIQAAVGLRANPTPIDWRRTAFIGAFQCAAIPFGILVMARLVDLGSVAVKQAVGATLLVVVTLRLVVQPRPRERLRWPWAALAGCTSGLLAGMVGMGGPPLVFYAQAHTWNKHEFRGFLWLQLLVGHPVLLAALAFKDGMTILWYFVMGLALAPALWLGTHGAFVLTARWKLRHVSLSATFLLYAIAIGSLVGPVLSP